jgi:hypothetical protein
LRYQIISIPGNFPCIQTPDQPVSNEENRNQSSIRRRVEEGRYANFFQIGHNAFEFLLEFGQLEGEEEAIHTRIYISPQHARMLSDLMNDTLRQHERMFGKSLTMMPREVESQ